MAPRIVRFSFISLLLLCAMSLIAAAQSCPEFMTCEGDELVAYNHSGVCGETVRVACENGCDPSGPDCNDPPSSCAESRVCISNATSRHLNATCHARESPCAYGCDTATGACRLPNCPGGEFCTSCDGTPCARYLTGNTDPQNPDACEVLEELCNPLRGCNGCTAEDDAQFCSRLNKRCGGISAKDNCDVTRTVNCTAINGDCPVGETCINNQCRSCDAETDAQFCQRFNATCGLLEENDNCGTARNVDCQDVLGACPPGNVCVNNNCEPCSSESNSAFCTRLSKRCGSVTDADNCGTSRTVDCTVALGNCPAGQSCIGNQCTTPCSSSSTAVYAGQTCFPYTLPCTAANCNERNISKYGGYQCAIGVSSGGGFGPHWPKDASGTQIKKKWVLVKSYDWTIPGPVKKAAINFAIVDDGVRVIVNGQTVYENVKTPSSGTNDCANMDPPGNVPARDPMVNILPLGAVQQGANHMEVYGCWAPGTDYPDAWARICYEYGPGSPSAGINCSAPGTACSPEPDAELCSCNGGKNCGQITVTDRCGASRTVNCGTCTAPQTCGGGGTANVCGQPCAAETNAQFCQRLNKRCGSVTANDNCNNPRTVDCTAALGACPAGQMCQSNQCVACTSETDAAFCSRLGINCAQASGNDNCGVARSVFCPCAGLGCTDSDGGSSYNTLSPSFEFFFRPRAGIVSAMLSNYGPVTRPADNGDLFTVGTVEGCHYDSANINNAFGPEKRVSATLCDRYRQIDVGIYQAQNFPVTALQDECGSPAYGCPSSSVWEFFCFKGSARMPPNTGYQEHGWIGLQCIPCPAGSTCSGGKCVCVPETDGGFCSRLGKNCGTISGTDNCGASRSNVNCGSCASPNTCGGGGTANVCGCAAETNAQFCSRLGKNCGTISGTDNCGASRSNVNCGSCASPNTCGGGGTANVCGCTDETAAQTCSRYGKNCGSFRTSNNCGKTVTVSCGTCSSGEYCGGSFVPNVCGIDHCEYRSPSTNWWPGRFSFDPSTSNYGYAAWLRGCGQTGAAGYNINNCPQWGIAPFPSGDTCGSVTCPQGFRVSVPGGGCTCQWPAGTGSGCGDHKACQSCLCVGASGLVSGQCGLARQVGQSCINPEDCGSRICQGGICRAGGPGTYCVYSTDCISGNCVGGIPSPVIKRGYCTT